MKADKSISLIILMLGLLSAAAAPACAQLRFEPSVWDFGAIREADGRVSHTFTGVNGGDKPVVILDVVTSCGCTVPEFSRKPVLPGERTAVTVTFDPANRPGTFVKELSVYSSERRKIATLTIRGNVIERERSIGELYPVDAGGGLRLSTSMSAFSYVYIGRRVQGEAGYANTSDRPVTLKLRPRDRSGALEIDCPTSIAPGERGTIRLSYFIPRDNPRYGTLNDTFEVAVDGRSNGTLLMAHGIAVDDPAASGKNRPEAQLSENILKFGAVKRRGPVARLRCTLSNTGRGELTVRAVESEGRFATTLAAGERVAPGHSRTFDVTLDPAAHDFGVVTDRLMIVTDDPARPMRRLRLTAVVEE